MAEIKSKSSTRAKNKYNGKVYDRLYPFVKAGNKKKIEVAAYAAGQSLNDYIVNAIYSRMRTEGFEIEEN